MVLEGKVCPTAMGQVGLCSTPQTDSLSPFNSGFEGGNQSSQSNGIPADDIMAVLSTLLANKNDLSSDSLLLKLQGVINENFELKDTITQNNLALRQQMNLFVQWNQQIEAQQRQHRHEVNGANKKVNLMQQENAMLKSALASFKNTNSASPKFEELDKIIKDLNQQLDQGEYKLQTALEERDSLSAQCTKLEGEVTLVKCDLAASRREFQYLNLQTHELISTIKELKAKLQKNESVLQRNEGLPQSQLQDALAREKVISETFLQQFKDSQNQVEYLEEELKLSRAETSKFKSVAQAPKESLSQSDTRMKTDDSEARKYKEEAAMLREEIGSLESALCEERRRTSDEKSALNRLQGEYSRLKKEMSDTMDRSEKNQYNDQYYQAKIKSIQEQHDESTAKLISYEELLGSKNEEISRFKRELGQTKASLTQLSSEGETIAVLRAQVEVYQSDFRAEREAREAMAADRERIRDDIRHLQARNTQLMDELEVYQRKSYNLGPGRSPRAGSEEANVAGTKEAPLPPLSSEYIWDKLSNESDKKGEEPKKEDVVELDENLLYCPKCNKTFTELRPLEEHVNRCLDED